VHSPLSLTFFPVAVHTFTCCVQFDSPNVYHFPFHHLPFLGRLSPVKFRFLCFNIRQATPITSGSLVYCVAVITSGSPSVIVRFVGRCLSYKQAPNCFGRLCSHHLEQFELTFVNSQPSSSAPYGFSAQCLLSIYLFEKVLFQVTSFCSSSSSSVATLKGLQKLNLKKAIESGAFNILVTSRADSTRGSGSLLVLPFG
jgi:hypothetical protein